jgi:hypothetical protein
VRQTAISSLMRQQRWNEVPHCLFALVHQMENA